MQRLIKLAPILVPAVVVALVCGVAAIERISPDMVMLERWEHDTYDWRCRQALDDNAPAATISMRYGWQGPCENTVTACAAGTHAIGNAARIASCQVEISVGAESQTAAVMTTRWPLNENPLGAGISDGLLLRVLRDEF